MPKETDKNKAQFKAGIFIIVILSILVFCIMWLRYFSLQPVMTVTAKFANPGPIAKGLQVYYQGVNIGKVSSINFSSDFKYTLVSLSILQKDLNIPSNVHAEVKTEGITGQKYIDIIYPDSPASRIIADKMIIYGKSPFGLTEIQEYFGEQIKSGKLTKMINKAEVTMDLVYVTSQRLNNITKNADDILTDNKDELNRLLKDSSKAASDFSSVMANVDDFLGNPDMKGDLRSTISSASNVANTVNEVFKDKQLGDSLRQTAQNINKISNDLNALVSCPEIQKGLRSTFGGLGEIFNTISMFTNGTQAGGAAPAQPNGSNSVSSLFSNLNQLIYSLNTNSNQVFKDINDSNLVENMSTTFSKASTTLDKTSIIIDKAQTQQGQNILQTINQAAYNHSEAMKNFNNVNCGLSDMLSKRFLLIRLLFGKPGRAFENCKTLNSCPAQTQQINTTPCPVVK